MWIGGEECMGRFWTSHGGYRPSEGPRPSGKPIRLDCTPCTLLRRGRREPTLLSKTLRTALRALELKGNQRTQRRAELRSFDMRRMSHFRGPAN